MSSHFGAIRHFPAAVSCALLCDVWWGARGGGSHLTCGGYVDEGSLHDRDEVVERQTKDAFS